MEKECVDMQKTACTTVIMGKNATMSGSVMIARNEDYHGPINPKVFLVSAPSTVKGRTMVSENTKLTYELPDHAMRYTRVPSRDEHEAGEYAEASINEAEVAVSSTESLYGNERVLALDPLVQGGVAEDAINDAVAPFVHSAREGVEFLGELIRRYGSAEGNGILFADREEAWYMEIPTGHHWVAVRIPDDSYAVAPNHVVIEGFDPSDSKNVLTSPDLADFIVRHRLNPRPGTLNFRKIFGTYRELDRVYNCPRAWYAHNVLSPGCCDDPTSGDIPFIRKAERLYAHEDIERVLGSHYNETIYDPIGTMGSEYDKRRFRSISLSRTSHGHILEIRPDAPKHLAGICRLSMGTGAFNPFVPFFTYVEDTPACYRDVTPTISLENAYWVAKLFGYFAEKHRDAFHRETAEYLQRMQILGRQRVEEVTKGAEGKSEHELLAYLTAENDKTAKLFFEAAKEKLESYARRALSSSELSFLMDKNL